MPNRFVETVALQLVQSCERRGQHVLGNRAEVELINPRIGPELLCHLLFHVFVLEGRRTTLCPTSMSKQRCNV
jgi:hypothetical protein